MKILSLLKDLLSRFDPYGVEHGERVAALAVRLASASDKIGAQHLRDIETAGLVHDVGKVGVPEAIRRLPGKYLPAEYDEMKKHVNYGAEMLSYITNGVINARVIEIVRFHHKDYCGTGYPSEPAIKEKEIPIGARILRICDYFDARTHERGYQHALSKADCLKAMEEDQIEHLLFDPDLLKLFIALMKEA